MTDFKSCCIAIVLFLIILKQTPEAQENVVVIDPSKRYQRFEGWGTSLCWWAVLAGNWSEENRKQLVGAIVNPDTGLGYNIFRYNIGGGDQPGHNHLTQGDGGAAVPGYKPTQDGPYNWKADSSQRNILIEIAKQVKDPIFEAFSNSPPWWMTKSGCVSGSADGSDNLKEDYFDDFADYLSEVARHFKEQWGIVFRTVEPFNEPSAGWWKANGRQEGCGFRNNQSKMIIELGKKLVDKKLFPITSVSASDETSIEQSLNSLKVFSSEAITYLSQINTHSYSGYNSRVQLAERVAEVEKRLWQSESGPLHKDDDSNIALWIANVIIKDLRDLKAWAWIDWQVCDRADSWMSIYTDHKKQSFSYRSRFYLHAAFSRFIRPGSQIIHSSNSNTVAALRPDNSLVIVVLNNSATDITCSIDLSGFQQTDKIVDVYQFELPGSLNPKPDVQVLRNNTFPLLANAQTVTTCVIADAVAAPCVPSSLVSYVQVNGELWQETVNVMVNAGDDVKLGPHPVSGGHWSWSGPMGFKVEQREVLIKDIGISQKGDYEAEYINSEGCTSRVTMCIDVKDNVGISLNDKHSGNRGRNCRIRNNKITIEGLPNTPVILRLYNLQGKMVLNKKFDGKSNEPHVFNVAGGYYIANIRDLSGKLLYSGFVGTVGN